MDELAAQRAKRYRAQCDADKQFLDELTGLAFTTPEQAHREWRLERMREDSPPARP